MEEYKMNEILNKKGLVDLVAEAKEMSKKQAAELVDFVFDTVKNELAEGNKVDIAGFGKFEVKVRNAREGINPKTLEKIHVASSKVPGFKAAKALKDAVK